MTSRRHLLAATVTGCTMGSLSQWAMAADPVHGKDYIDVRPPVALPDRPILVHDFFAYTCPHCLQFEPVMSRFVQEMKGVADVRVVPVPVAWNESYGMFPRAYYSFEVLNRMHDLHPEFWDWVIREEHDWKSTEDVENDITNWVVKNGGIKAEQWKKTMTSFTVASRARAATQTWKQYGIDSTPCVGVAGRYLCAPHLSGTRQGAIDAVKYLIGRIRAEAK